MKPGLTEQPSPVAMILAAGYGTRLKPLTDRLPKALVSLQGKPLLYYILRRLQSLGIQHVVINVHHYADQILNYLDGRHFPGLLLSISDESEHLLDTGGALSKALPLFGLANEVLVHNVDVISDINLHTMLRQHRTNKAAATLAVRNRHSSRYLRISPEGLLCGWENRADSALRWSGAACPDSQQMAFSGIHILNVSLIRAMPAAGSFPIIPEYLRMAASHRIEAFPHNSDHWMDMGRPEDLSSLEQWMQTPEGKQWTQQYLDGWSPS